MDYNLPPKIRLISYKGSKGTNNNGITITGKCLIFQDRVRTEAYRDAIFQQADFIKDKVRAVKLCLFLLRLLSVSQIYTHSICTL